MADNICSACGKIVATEFCPVCFKKWDPGSSGPEPEQYCFECLEKHYAAHKPELPSMTIWKNAPNNYRIECEGRMNDQLCDDEALGVAAAWLLRICESGGHRYMQTRDGLLEQQEFRTKRLAQAEADRKALSNG